MLAADNAFAFGVIAKLLAELLAGAVQAAHDGADRMSSVWAISLYVRSSTAHINSTIW